VIPLATLIVAFVAIRQIRRSAGTQTGIAIAILGLLLALGFVGFIGGREVINTQRIKSETAQIQSLIESLGQDINKGDYDAAYQKFSERLQQRVTKEQFKDRLEFLQNHAAYGKIATMKSNGIVDVRLDSESGQWGGIGVILLELTNGKPDRREAMFRRDDKEGWRIEDVQGFFPPPAPRTPQRAPGAGG
jgi:hypothetical protein